MTLALYGKSKRRQSVLLAAALFAVVIATIGALGAATIAFAHHNTYTASRQCDGSWTAKSTYVGGNNRKLVLIKDVVINGAAYQASWANSSSDPPPDDSGDGGTPKGTNQVIARSSYTGAGTSTAGLPSDPENNDFLWVGVDGGFTIFDRSGGAGTFQGGSANWKGSIELYNWNGSQWVKESSNSVNVTEPSTSGNCGTIIIKKVVAGQGSDPADQFSADVNNKNGSEGDANNLPFSQNSPKTHNVSGHGSKHDFEVEEDPPGNDYQVVGSWSGSGDAACPAVGSNAWDTSRGGDNQNDQQTLSNLGSATKTVCFLNVKVTAKTCSDLGLALIEEWEWTNNGYSLDGEGLVLNDDGVGGNADITITNGTANGGTWSSPVPIGAVIVKGGSGPVAYKLFPFPPPYPADTYSGSFDNTGLVNWGGNTPAVSHVEFCSGTSTPKGTIIVGKVKDPTAGVPAADGSQFSGTATNQGNAAVTNWGPIGFGAFATLSNVPQGTYTLAETGTQNGWTPYGWASGTFANNQASCPTEKSSYAAGANVTNVQVNTNETTVVCVMNTKTAATPTIAKVKASEGYSNGYAYWEIQVTNPENISQTVQIADSGVTYVSHSGGTCSDTDFSDGSITCSVDANSTLVVKVKKAVTTQCQPFTINNTATVYLVPPTGGEPQSIGSAGGDANTEYTIPADTTKCDKPGITKTATTTSTTDPSQIQWTVTVTNPATGSNGTGRTVRIKDSNVAVVSGPTYSGSASCEVPGGSSFEQELTGSAGVSCSMPNGSSISFVVKPATTPARTCEDQVFQNTAYLYVDNDTQPIAGEGPAITLQGDPALCTKTIKVCKVVENNGDQGIHANLTFTIDVNDGSQTQQVSLTTSEGADPVCEDVTVPANANVTVTETAARPIGWLGDWPGYPKVTVDGNTYTVTNKELPTIAITFDKKICKTLADVPKNPGDSLNHIGAPYFTADPSALGTTEGDCGVPETEWFFELWTGTTSNYPYPGSSPTGGTLLGTIGTASFRLLSATEVTSLITDGKLFVKENYQTGFAFGTLKCEGDSYNNDNWEWLYFDAVKGGKGTCTAYNVPATKEIVIQKEFVGVNEVTPADYPTFTISDGIDFAEACTGPKISSGDGSVFATWTCTVPLIWNGTVSETPAKGWERCESAVALQTNGELPEIFPFTNCKKPTVTVKKVVTNVVDDTTQFTVTLDGSQTSQTGQIAESSANGPVNATFTASSYQQYTVTEQGQNGYQVLGWADATDGVCPSGPKSNTNNTASLGTLLPGENVVICFYNERFGNVVVDKQAPSGAVVPGVPFNWVISISVADGPTSSQLKLTDTLPSGFSYGSPVATSPLSCTLSSGTLSCTLPQNTPIGTYTVTIPATAPTGTFEICGEHTNTVIFAGAGTEGSDSATVTVGCTASDGRILVKKVVRGPGQSGDTTVFTANLSGPGITGTATQPFSQQNVGFFLGLSAGSFTLSETPKPGYAYAGWAVGAISGDGVICPANPTSTDVDALVSITNVAPQAAICFYNDPKVTIRVHKTLDVVGFTSDGAGWQFTLTGCGITPQTATTDSNGIVEFTNLPPAVGCSYTVTETVQAGWNPQFVSQTAQPTQGGQVVTLEFLNIKIFNPPCVDPKDPRCSPPPSSTPTPTPTTPSQPTPTPTNTPTPTTPGQPTNTPTPTNTPVTQVAGERTPGPGQSPTPLAPATGYGSGASQGGTSLLLVLAGLVSLSLGLAFLALGRRRSDR